MDDERQGEAFLKTLTVLYVEDDAETRLQLSRFLRRRVGTLLTAESGKAALGMFIEHKPAMVITDIMMPEMDGLALAQELRKLAPRIPIIVITAFEQSDYLMRAIDIGIDKYITKPINTQKAHLAMAQVAHQLQSELMARRFSEFLSQSRRLEALGVMAGGMAHDFNNLFQIISGNIELALLCAEEGSSLRSCLEDACSGCERGKILGQTLLDLTDSAGIHDRRDSLLPLVRETVAAALADTQIVFECRLPERLPAIVYNETHMRLVFYHLAANARDAMPCGGTLTVSCEPSSLTAGNSFGLAAGDYLHFIFQDTGRGIHPDHLPRIFDPYWTTQSLDQRKGLGLGLTLSYTIMKKHRGFICAESEPGRGAAFHLYLPISG